MRLPLLQMGRFLRSRVGSFDAPAWGLAEQLFFSSNKKKQAGEIAVCKQCHALFACKASCEREATEGRENDCSGLACDVKQG